MRLFSDPADDEAFLSDDDLPSETSLMNPMELDMDRDQLIADTELRIQELREFNGLDPRNLTHQRYVRACIQQAVDWMAWLRRQPDGRIRMSVYPTKSADELLAELPETDELDPDDNDLPLY